MNNEPPRNPTEPDRAPWNTKWIELNPHIHIPPRLSHFDLLVFSLPLLPADRCQAYQWFRNAGYRLYEKIWGGGGGGREMGRQAQRTTAERHGTPRNLTEAQGAPNGGNYALKSTLLSSFSSFALLVSALPLPADQCRKYHRPRNAAYWPDWEIMGRWAGNGATGAIDRCETTRNPTERQMDGITPSHSTFCRRFRLPCPHTMNTKRFGGCERWVLVGWGIGEWGEGREMGRQAQRTTAEPHGTQRNTNGWRSARKPIFRRFRPFALLVSPFPLPIDQY